MKAIKASLKGLKPYQPNQQSYRIKLDANESKNYLFSSGIDLKQLQVNMYPDSNSTELRIALGQFVGINPERIIAGNGSSEMIELVLKTYVDKGDAVLSFEPSFSMYSIYTKIHNGNYIAVHTDDTFKQDIDQMIEASKTYDPKIIFVCSPNNPTGRLIPNADILRLVQQTEAMVCVDEAYIEFTNVQPSLIDQVDKYPNLIVLRTLSKAFGLAGIRLGFLVSNSTVVETLNRVKSPYNLNVLTQQVGILALSQTHLMRAYTSKIMSERTNVFNQLSKLNLTVYQSEANFIFFKSTDPQLFNKLLKKSILIRAFTGPLENYYRVSIGDRLENEKFIEALKEILI